MVTLVLRLLLGCGGARCEADALSAGAIEGEIDGASWEGAAASWSESSGGVQLLSTESDGWRLTLVGLRAADGAELGEALSSGQQQEIELTDGNFAVLYPTGQSASFAAREAGSGTAILRRDGDDLLACFDFVGTAADGTTAALREGRARASCVGCP